MGETVPIPDEIWTAVDAAIARTSSPEGEIVPLPKIMVALKADSRDYKTKRLVSRAMHLRGVPTHTAPRNGSGGSYLVTPEARAAVVAMKKVKT